MLLNHGCTQALGSSVDCSAQAGWATAHNNKIVEGRLGLSLETHFLGQGAVVGLDEHLAIGEKHDWEMMFALLCGLHQLAGL